MPPKTHVVAYCRVSTLEQKRKGLGIEIQVRDLTLFAESRGLLIDHFYKDEAESGIDENRRGLRRLLRDCKKGQIKAVIIPSLDRLSRDVRLAENLFWKFEKLGVQIHIADMPFYNGQDRRDVLLRQIREAIAEDNRKDIIERLLKGRQERIRKGHPPGGNVPYGYQRKVTGKGKHLIPHTPEVEIIKVIFELEGHGKSRSEIAMDLNNRGYNRRNGKPWITRQVSAIFQRRDFYLQGIVRYGGVTGRDQSLILVRNRNG